MSSDLIKPKMKKSLFCKEMVKLMNGGEGTTRQRFHKEREFILTRTKEIIDENVTKIIGDYLNE